MIMVIATAHGEVHGTPDPYGHFVLGLTEKEAGQLGYAKDEYRQVLKLDPTGLIGRFARSVLDASK